MPSRQKSPRPLSDVHQKYHKRRTNRVDVTRWEWGILNEDVVGDVPMVFIWIKNLDLLTSNGSRHDLSFFLSFFLSFLIRNSSWKTQWGAANKSRPREIIPCFQMGILHLLVQIFVPQISALNAWWVQIGDGFLWWMSLEKGNGKGGEVQIHVGRD